MKNLRRFLFLPAFSAIILFSSISTGCSTPPSQRVVEVKTLEVIGASAKTSLQAAATLLAQGRITVAQWQSIATFYDTKFQPAYNLAVTAASSNLSSVASPDLIGLASQFANLISQLTPTN